MNREATTLFEFQNQAVDELLQHVDSPERDRDLILSAPTGAGKTLILANFVERYLQEADSRSAFVWLTPGAGDLEQQSKKKMQKWFPEIRTQDLDEVLRDGFSAGSVSFINWEQLVGKGRLATRPSERSNIYDRISEAKRAGTSFVVIVDEEHSNDTARAQNVLSALAAHRTIRASATPRRRSEAETVSIAEADVIEAGLITKAIYVNDGLETAFAIENEHDALLRLAETKRRTIQKEYDDRGIDIKPLVLIQFPNGVPEAVASVERRLADMGYTYTEGSVAKWFSNDRQGKLDGIEDNSSQTKFLLMKQAVSTGWDCPRAKILVKLRENMNEQFEIQTIGRIRRMPEAKHYGQDALDCCFVYTFDENFKSEVISNYETSYETKTLHLKPDCRDFSLMKQIRDRDSSTVNERGVLVRLREGLTAMYNLDRDPERNKLRMAAAGYILDDCIHKNTVVGRYVSNKALEENNQYVTMRLMVDTHAHGRLRMHAIDKIKTEAHISYSAMRTILERLFLSSGQRSDLLLSLSRDEFYAFVINNQQRLRDDVRSIAAQTSRNYQLQLPANPKESRFMMPETDQFRYRADRPGRPLKTNAYAGYTADCLAARSTPERLFEEMIERERRFVEWVYKNGDNGSEYFSIVYHDGLGNEHLFYPDYIIQLKDGETWIIEAKGGENSTQDKNIDSQAPNKFEALKEYVGMVRRRDPNVRLHWGFVRDKDGLLYINNEEYVDSMDDQRWRPTEQVLF